jgi:hypothetical protein
VTAMTHDFTVEGRPVEYVFFPGDPLVASRAEYRLVNTASGARACKPLSCHFVENGTAIPLATFYVYAGDALLEKGIVVPPAASLDITVTFPFREVHVGLNFRYAVRLTLECDARRYEATSTLTLVQEKSRT